MFHSQNLLSGKGPLGSIWVAAYFHKKLKKAQITQTDISSSVDKILQDVLNVVTYRVLAYFLLGVVRIYSRKVEYLFNDCNKVLTRIKDFVVSEKGNLHIETKKSPFHSIKRPKRFELDAFDLEIVDDAIEDDDATSEDLNLRDGTRNSKRRSSCKYHCEELLGSHMICSTECTLVEGVSSQLDEVDMEVVTLYSQSTFGIWKGNLQERFCQEESGDLANDYTHSGNLKISETEQQESRTDHIQEDYSDLNNLERSIEKLLVDEHPREQHMNDMIFGAGMNSSETCKQSLEEEHIDLETEQHEDDMDFSDTEQQESLTDHIHEEDHELNNLEGSIEKLLDNGRPVEQHMDDMILGAGNPGMDSTETSKPSVEEQFIELEQMKLLETPTSNQKKFTAGTESLKETCYLTPQSRSQRTLSTKSRKGAGSNSWGFMLIPTPITMESARTSRKRKCLMDDMTVLSNEILKQNIHDSSNLVCKRRKVPHSTLASWKSERLADLSQVFLEPLVPCISSELKSLFRTEKLNIPVLVESGEASEKTYAPVTPTLNKIEQQKEAPLKMQSTDASLRSDVRTAQTISGLVKLTQNAQEVLEAEASRDTDMSKSPSINKSVEEADITPQTPMPQASRETGTSKSPSLNKSVEEAEIAPETPVPHFRSSTNLFESPDSSTNINFDGSRHGSLSENMGREILQGRDQELDLTSMDKEQKSVESSNINQDGEWSSRTRTVAKYLQRNYLIQKQQGKDELNLLQLTEGKTKKENAKLFYEVLVLKSKGCVDVKQEKPYGDILVSSLPALNRTWGR